jgi:hypothetical protein
MEDRQNEDRKRYWGKFIDKILNSKRVGDTPELRDLKITRQEEKIGVIGREEDILGGLGDRETGRSHGIK